MPRCRWMNGFLSFRATVTVFLALADGLSAKEKTAMGSETRTFHPRSDPILGGWSCHCEQQEWIVIQTEKLDYVKYLWSLWFIVLKLQKLYPIHAHTHP